MMTNNIFSVTHGNIWCNKCSHTNGTNTCDGNAMIEIYMNHNTASLIIIIIRNE